MLTSGEISIRVVATLEYMLFPKARADVNALFYTLFFVRMI